MNALQNYDMYLSLQKGLLSNMIRHPKIIIIGAGAAGIAAAVKLLNNGFKNIKILEAEGRIGGRINSIQFGDSMVDLGAQWCHGEDNNIVFDYADKLGLLQTSRCTYKDNTFYDSTGAVIDKTITDTLFGLAATITYDYEVMKSTKVSFGDYFILRYIKLVKHQYGCNKNILEIANSFIHWFHKLILCYDAPHSWFDLSASGLLQYKDCDGDPLLNWKDKGYIQFLEILMQRYQGSTSFDSLIFLNKEVKRILWNNSYSADAVVQCSDGTSYSADHVIFTASLGVLKEHHKTLFVPELPFKKVNAIESLGFGTVNKILIKFPYQWWDTDTTNFCFAWTQDDRMNIMNEFSLGPFKYGKSWLEDINGFYVIDSDPTVLLAWVVGKMTKKVELLSNQVIEKACMYLLHKFLGALYDIPKPQRVICSRWYHNEHFRGSYSYRSVQADKRNVCSNDLPEPLFGRNDKPIVLFGGEATHTHYYSTVHGAVETGYREANRIIQYYKLTKNYEDQPRLSAKY